MDPKQMGKQMVEFNKVMFNNYFSAICVLQDQTEKAFEQMMAQSPMFPQEVKAAITNWFGTYKQGRDNFKTFAEDNFKKMEELCSGKK
jgi:putative IMPACT (imprinted ancient) family translation regulator